MALLMGLIEGDDVEKSAERDEEKSECLEESSKISAKGFYTNQDGINCVCAHNSVVNVSKLWNHCKMGKRKEKEIEI